jgi:uncharacterized coiled-coil protein SlyX
MTEIKTFLRENSTLAYFLVAQLIFFGGLAFGGYGYMVKLETRVATLETRGSPHLNVIDNRLTVLESTTAENKARLEKVTDVMTRRLQINP